MPINFIDLKTWNFFTIFSLFFVSDIEELTDLSINDDLNVVDGRSIGESRRQRQRRKGFLKRLFKFLVALKLLNRNWMTLLNYCLVDNKSWIWWKKETIFFESSKISYLGFIMYTKEESNMNQAERFIHSRRQYSVFIRHSPALPRSN